LSGCGRAAQFGVMLAIWPVKAHCRGTAINLEIVVVLGTPKRPVALAVAKNGQMGWIFLVLFDLRYFHRLWHDRHSPAIHLPSAALRDDRDLFRAPWQPFLAGPGFLHDCGPALQAESVPFAGDHVAGGIDDHGGHAGRQPAPEQFGRDLGLLVPGHILPALGHVVSTNNTINTKPTLMMPWIRSRMSCMVMTWAPLMDVVFIAEVLQATGDAL